MKRLIFPLIVVVFILSACKGKNTQAATDMANEMCKAMELIKSEDPMSMLEAASAMTKIAEKTEQYGQVTEDQLLDAMKNICPEGAAKFAELSSGGEAATE